MYRDRPAVFPYMVMQAKRAMCNCVNCIQFLSICTINPNFLQVMTVSIKYSIDPIWCAALLGQLHTGLGIFALQDLYCIRQVAYSLELTPLFCVGCTF